jgi:hypothetical protein
MQHADVMLIGLGDLGGRVLHALARSTSVRSIIATARNPQVGAAHVSQASLISALSGGPERIWFEALDLDDPAALPRLLGNVHPEVIVIAASRVTWWRTSHRDPQRAAALAALPYGAWLPVHMDLVQRSMRAVREHAPRAKTVCLPIPDLVGPALRPLGLAPSIGAGNVSEVAAKLQVLASRELGVSRNEVHVRLVMHHALERIAFPAFSTLSGERAVPGEPPWHGSISAGGTILPASAVSRLVHTPYPLRHGVETHDLTATATLVLIESLLADVPSSVHAPAPGGLPGGYPLIVSRHAIDLDVAPDLSPSEAIHINERAAAWDGVERVEPDGTVVFTAPVVDAVERVLGITLPRFQAPTARQVADEMLERAARIRF